MIRIQSRYFDGPWTIGFHSIPHQGGVLVLVQRGEGELRVLDAVASEDLNIAAQQFIAERRLACNPPGAIVGLATLVLRDSIEAAAVAFGLCGHRQADGGYVESPRSQCFFSGEELRAMASASAWRALGSGWFFGAGLDE